MIENIIFYWGDALVDKKDWKYNERWEETKMYSKPLWNNKQTKPNKQGPWQAYWTLCKTKI